MGRLYVAEDPLERLLRQVEIADSGCWLFTGATKNGYAVISEGHDGWHYGHRLAYERLVGPIPAERPRLHHACEVRLCVNPLHLEPVSAREHAHHHGLGVGPCRACGEDDWYIRRDNGNRMCRECKRRRRRNRAAC